MQITISKEGMIAGTIFGFVLRFALTFSQIYSPGLNWWFHHGFEAVPGTAGFSGYVDTDILVSHNENVGYCLLVSLLPGILGGVIGAVSGATGRPFIGAALGGSVSGVVILLMRLPELYRPGWFGNLWLSFNIPILVEATITGAVIGAYAGMTGWVLGRPRHLE